MSPTSTDEQNKKSENLNENSIVVINVHTKEDIMWKSQNGLRISESDVSHDLSIPENPDSSASSSNDSEDRSSGDSDKFFRASQFKIRIMEMELILRERLSELDKEDIHLNEIAIEDMAKQIFDELKNKDIARGIAEKKNDEFEDFVPDGGWLDKFRLRSKSYFTQQNKERNRYLRNEIKRFITVFRDHIKKEGYLPEQVFNADVTKLFWKRMPENTFISKEAALNDSNDPMSRISLMLATNASGDFKLEPMLIYHDDDLEVFTKNVISSSNLGVFWRCNKEIRMTKADFITWMAEIFCPSVNIYLNLNNMEKKILLLLNNSQDYEPNIELEVQRIFPYINIMLMPKEVASYIQPINSHVIDVFRRLYTKKVFQMCLRTTKRSQLETEEAVRNFWKFEFHIFQAIDIIESVWRSIPPDFFNAEWGMLWPEIQRTFADISAPMEISSEITAIGQVIGFNVIFDDVEKLINSHNKPVTRVEILELKRRSIRKTESVPTELLEESLDGWNAFERVLPYHPSVDSSSCLVKQFKAIVSYFRRLLRDRKFKEVREQQMLSECEPPKRPRIDDSSTFDLMNLPPGTSNTYFIFE